MQRYDDQVCLKLAGPLRAALEEEAAARGRSLSNLIRAILLEHATKRVVGGAAVPMEKVA
jgi:Ribbon-helix-helix protein, copG family